MRVSKGLRRDALDIAAGPCFVAIMIRRVIATFMLIGLHSAAAEPACKLASAPAVPVIKGLAYDQARAALLAGGWQPGHGSQFSDMDATQEAFHERGYTELRSCSGSQGTTCHFMFAAGSGVVLEVTTQGEENAVLNTRAVVVAADLGCDS